MLVNFDFEVYSELSIKAVPLDVYAAHPSTKIILNAYSFDDGPVKVWQFTDGPCPEFREAIANPDNMLVAWNVNYERTVLAGRGFKTPISRWIDPMVHARYAGLPGRLKDCAKIPMLGIPETEKTKSETLLINKFCMPGGKGKTVSRSDGNGTVQVPDGSGRQIMPDEYPEDWALFVDYCRKDVLTMRHVHNWLIPRFPFPDRERQIWELDQTINQRGLPGDASLAAAANRETARLISAGQHRLKEITGLENPNSIMQLLPWLKDHGYKYDSLPKELVKQGLEESLSEEAPTLNATALRQALEVRLETSKSSVKKFDKMVKATSPDGRIRNQFVYYGAHTGRWSGRDIQPHNLPRKKTDQATLNALLEMARPHVDCPCWSTGKFIFTEGCKCHPWQM